MHFLVIGHVVHKFHNGTFFAYGPYVREMNLWFKHVEEVTILAPVDFNLKPDPIDLPYAHSRLKLISVPEFNLQGIRNVLKTLVNLPEIFFKTARAISKADHVHLRCPGNMGLVGALVQFFYPEKLKTAKYAGNWDRSSQQPFTYRLQQNIISNPSLAKNMKVLVYGEWPDESTNVYPFFTATYSEKEKEPVVSRVLGIEFPLRLVFVGGLNTGKQPLISAQVLKKLREERVEAYLDFFGEGPERKSLEQFIEANSLEEYIKLHGNVPAQKVKYHLQNSHFLIFISKSEGWPKVVAESMFWGCLPITTPVSCVPQMVGKGTRGDLVSGNPNEIVEIIKSYMVDPKKYFDKVEKAFVWSMEFTLEKFEAEIEFLLLDSEK